MNNDNPKKPPILLGILLVLMAIFLLINKIFVLGLKGSMSPFSKFLAIGISVIFVFGVVFILTSIGVIKLEPRADDNDE